MGKVTDVELGARTLDIWVDQKGGGSNKLSPSSLTPMLAGLYVQKVSRTCPGTVQTARNMSLWGPLHIQTITSTHHTLSGSGVFNKHQS